MGRAATAGGCVVTETYTAYVMPGPGQGLEAVQRDVPAPGPGEVLMRVRATSLNYHDWVNLQGFLEGPWPRVPFADGAGEIVAVGEGVAEFVAGDRVFAAMYPSWLEGPPDPATKLPLPGDTIDGWLQEYRVSPASCLVRTPEHLSDAEAATFPSAGVTAYSAIAAASIGPGDVVVSQGTGGVSLFAVQVAKARGATVILTSSSDEKLEIGRSLGADHLINYRTTPYWEGRVRELTDSRGADLVVDLGGPETLPKSLSATRQGGMIAVIGVLTGFGMTELPVAQILWENLHLVGITVGSVQAHREMAELYTDNKIHPYISHTLDWTQVSEATRILDAGEHVGKIALTI